MFASARTSPAERTYRVAAGTTAFDALRGAGVELTGPHGAVVVRDSDGALRDLAWAPEEDTDVGAVSAESPDGLAVLRHSAAHAMAQAVQDLFPGALLGIGPPIEDGFYYDFLPDRPFTPDDLSAIEKKMAEIIKSGQRFVRRPVSDDEARAELADEKFKLELIGLKSQASGDEATEVGAGGLTMYDNVDAKTGDRVWTDLCRGPHLPSTRRIPAVKLMRSAAAYWRGNEKNPQLQRIYGTAWATRDDLKAYLHRLEEAARRDHRRFGAELDLFSFPDELGSGLAVFHPKGGILRREMENYARQRHIDEGFEFVNTPHITKDGLFHTSGHLPYYADTMFPPMEFEGANYRVKPMNCPMHNLIYRSRGRSYRELPLRLFEFGSVYRYEKSGVVHGLTRVRGLTYGRLAQLLHPRAGARRDQEAAELHPRPAQRLRAGRLLPRAVHPRRGLQQVHRLGRASGRSRPGSSPMSRPSPGSSSSTTRVAPRSTARRSRCRRATRSAVPGRWRPSSTTSTSRPVSGSSTRPPTAAGNSR